MRSVGEVVFGTVLLGALLAAWFYLLLVMTDAGGSRPATPSDGAGRALADLRASPIREQKAAEPAAERGTVAVTEPVKLRDPNSEEFEVLRTTLRFAAHDGIKFQTLKLPSISMAHWVQTWREFDAVASEQAIRSQMGPLTDAAKEIVAGRAFEAAPDEPHTRVYLYQPAADGVRAFSGTVRVPLTATPDRYAAMKNIATTRRELLKEFVAELLSHGNKLK